MRFFTMTWWRGVPDGFGRGQHDDYVAYVTALRVRVPPERLPTLNALLALALHDAELRHLRLEPAAATLHISLENRGEEKGISPNNSLVIGLIPFSLPAAG